MAIEIERKFLLLNDDWRSQVTTSTKMHQGYMATLPDCTTRVRIAGDKAYLTVKGRISLVTKREYEYEVPLADAEQMLQYFCQNRTLKKTRHLAPYAGNTFEIDEFEEQNSGLVVAEIELAEENQHFEKPGWLGKEVTEESCYRNSALVQHPFLNW